MDEEVEDSKIVKRRTTDGWSWSIEIDASTPNGIVKVTGDFKLLITFGKFCINICLQLRNHKNLFVNTF